MNIVMGNGESRLAVSYDLLAKHTTYGCNALHRDFNPTALVAIDTKMLHEVVASGYSKQNKCYFRFFTLMEPFHYEMLILTAEGEVFENEKTGYKFAYYGQEKEREFYDETQTMDVVAKPQHWFTWVSEEDKIYDLNEIIGDSGSDSGQSAVDLMCIQEKPEKCYLLGFDLSNNNGKVNNIYKGTHCYAPDYALPVEATRWTVDLGLIFDKYPQTEFIHVQDVKIFDTIETISVKQFINILENNG